MTPFDADEGWQACIYSLSCRRGYPTYLRLISVYLILYLPRIPLPYANGYHYQKKPSKASRG